MQYQHELQQHKMEKGESSSLESCANLFSMRQYVLLSRQKDIFQNWPFAEKYLRLCLKYGVPNVLPPLEARDLPEKTSITSETKIVSNSDRDSAVKPMIIANHSDESDNDHTSSFESTISSVCEKIQLMSLSCNDYKQEKANHSDAHISDTKNIMNNAPVKPMIIAAPKRERSRKWRRKMKSLTEIFATAKYRTLDEDDDMNDLSCTADSITSEKEEEHMQKFKQVDFEHYFWDSKSELTDDGADHNHGLPKRRRVLKPWSKSPYKATLITKNRSRGCNRKTQEIYGPKSAFELQDAYIC